jgi:hypothetical protein
MESIGLLLPFAFMGLVMVGFAVALFTFMARRIRRALSPEGKAEVVANAQTWVSEDARGLAPWGPGSIADLSTVVTYRWTRTVNEETKGVVEAVSVARPLLAFATVWGLSGRHILARTTAHTLKMEAEGTALDPAVAFHIFLNGRPLGSWRTNDGALLDPSGAQIGEAVRGATYRINGVPTNWKDRWYGVTLHGREVGAVLAQRGAKDLRWLVPVGEKASVVQLPDDAGSTGTLDPEAERWLLALATIEIAFTQVARSAGTGLHRAA